MARDATRMPRWAVTLLERLIPIRQRGVVLGDFAEAFQWRAEEEGRGRALWWFWTQVFKSLPAFFLDGFYFGSVMFRSYFTVAVRNLRKRLFFSTLNIGGLAIGMAACLLIFQYVAFEYSYDDFHEHQEELHRVIIKNVEANGVSYDRSVWSALGPAAKAGVPEVKDFVRIHPNYGEAIVSVPHPGGEPRPYQESGLIFADPSLFHMMTFPLIQGDPRTALQEPETVFLSASTAQRYFGDRDPLGQVLEIRGWESGSFRVAGIFADIPAASSIRFDLVAPLTALLGKGQYEDTDGWSWTNFDTYVQIAPEVAPAVETQLQNLAVTHNGWDEQESQNNSLLVQPLEEMHLFSAEYGVTGSDYRTVYFLTVVAVFILLIAWVNYINLSTARAMERAKEVGVRKAAGARRQQLISQFLFESVLMNGLALVLAIGLATILTPLLGTVIGAELSMDLWTNPWFWGVFLGLFVLGAVVASVYPALLLSSFQPVDVLKGTLGGRTTKAGLRKALVTFQFAASIALLTGTYTVYHQVQHLRTVDLGLDAAQVVTLRGPRIYAEGLAPEARADMRRAFFDELAQIPGLEAFTRSSSVPGQGYNLGTTSKRYGLDDETRVAMNMAWVNPSFFETYGIDLTAGRFFSEDFALDNDTAVVANEAMVRALGFASNEDAVGESVTIAGSFHQIIVGVIEDVHWMSTAQEITPIFLGMSLGGGMYSLRLRTGQMQETLATVEAIYQKHFPGNPFSYQFVDALYQRQYESDQRFGTMFGLFAVFALVVACLGLVGLAAYTAALRTREIGVRKVLGASVPSIVRLLVRDFAVLLVAALVLTAVPMYFALDAWLNGFAERIPLTPMLFLVPGLVVFLFAGLTVSYHTLRSAVLEPAKALRYQ